LKTYVTTNCPSDPGGILTPNPQSRNLMRYTVAPRSLNKPEGIINCTNLIESLIFHFVNLSLYSNNLNDHANTHQKIYAVIF
jgi:hypothetical protein